MFKDFERKQTQEDVERNIPTSIVSMIFKQERTGIKYFLIYNG